MVTEYEKIRKELMKHYDHEWGGLSIGWISNRIIWAAKFKKITDIEKDRLVNMVLGLTDPDLYYDFKTEKLRYLDNDQEVVFG